MSDVVDINLIFSDEMPTQRTKRTGSSMTNYLSRIVGKKLINDSLESNTKNYLSEYNFKKPFMPFFKSQIAHLYHPGRKSRNNYKDYNEIVQSEVEFDFEDSPLSDSFKKISSRLFTDRKRPG